MKPAHYQVPAELIECIVQRLRDPARIPEVTDESLMALSGPELSRMLESLVRKQDSLCGKSTETGTETANLSYPLTEEEQKQKATLLSQLRMKVTKLTLKNPDPGLREPGSRTG